MVNVPTEAEILHDVNVILRTWYKKTPGDGRTGYRSEFGYFQNGKQKHTHLRTSYVVIKKGAVTATMFSLFNVLDFRVGNASERCKKTGIMGYNASNYMCPCFRF